MSLIRNKVFEQIRRDIVTCDFQPGEELREAELADRYNVSKSPVREALQRLQYENLIETLPRRGHRVTPISVADAQDILEMRDALEAAALRRIVKTAKADQLAALDSFREADVEKLDGFARYNHRFHVEIATLSGNRRIAEETRRLLDSYARLCRVSLQRMKTDEGTMGKALADHCQLIDALQARDAGRAVKISQRHLRQSRDLIIKGLANRPIID